MELSRRPRHAAKIAVQQFDDEILLLAADGGTGIWLNQTASLVWLLCNGQRTVGEIIALLQEEFPVEADDVSAEVADALRTLSGHGAIEVE